jgi:methionyl-tRNA synthetase
VPESRRNEVLQILEDGLQDISVSRPKAKIPWGIPVPGDNEQIMYVWFEALANYVTTLGYPDGPDMRYWPANIQVVGKDITRFHALIWPAMLLAADLPVYKTLYVHGFVTMDGKKMSKSIGNVVSPLEILRDYGVDAMRYYFLRHIPSHDDGDFTWAKFEAAYNNELGNDLGNLVQRVAKMIHRYQDGVIGDVPPPEHDTGPYHDALEELRFDKALDYTWGLIRGLNQYLEEERPWELAKDPAEADHVREIIAYVVSSILQVSALLHPFMPQAAASIHSIFKDGVVTSYDGVLFPRKELHTPPRS